MKALVWHGAHDIRIETRPIPQPGPGEVLVEMKAVGICGSDVKLYAHGVLGTHQPSGPYVMGHEGTGRIVELGAGVEDLAVGDRVCIDPEAPCHDCFYCRRGDVNLCQHLDFKSVTTDGLLSEYAAVRAHQAFSLPDTVDFVSGTVIEPLSIAVQAVRMADLHPNDSVVILGVGSIGLLSLAVIRTLGVRKIAAIDIRPSVLDMATRVGASVTIDNTKPGAVERVVGLWNGPGPDVVFEMAGSSETQAQAIEMVRPGGTVVMAGITPDPTAALNANRIVRSNLRVFGSVRISGDAFVTAAGLIGFGQIDVGPLISRVFPFDQAPAAFAFKEDADNNAIKCVVEVT
jgi:L-iditol 2-dehydrogenase